VADLGGKGRVTPQRGVARRDDIDMARKAEMRRPVAETRIEIIDRRRVLVLEIEAPEGEARRPQRADEHLERARVFRRHAFASDQALRDLEGFIAECGHWRAKGS